MVRSPNQTLGTAVRALREERGISREVFAVNAGLTTGTLARLELGRSDPSWSTIRAIANALGMTAAEFIATAEAEERG